jgi:hypothetical protein
VDEWPGEDPDSGTSVRALFKVLKRIGYVREYRWAYDVETLVQQVLAVGPVVMGTSWFYDMMDPDRWGYIQPTGSSMGGHAWLIIGASRTRVNPDKTIGAVRMINSGVRRGAMRRAVPGSPSRTWRPCSTTTAKPASRLRSSSPDFPSFPAYPLPGRAGGFLTRLSLPPKDNLARTVPPGCGPFCF